jgi:glycosyltransferase involved in cell wall biosynthesis
MLPLISEKIVFKNLNIDWTIIGAGMERQEVENLMHQHSGISYYPTLNNEKVIELLPQHDLFILPSLKEGFPVAVVEAMKAGLVPLVTNWEGATEELIVQGETGFYFEPGDVNGYADKIESLNSERTWLKKMAKAGQKKANELFDPQINTRAIEEIIIAASENNMKNKKAIKVYGSRLDQEWMLNIVTHTIRKKMKK